MYIYNVYILSTYIYMYIHIYIYIYIYIVSSISYIFITIIITYIYLFMIIHSLLLGCWFLGGIFPCRNFKSSTPPRIHQFAQQRRARFWNASRKALRKRQPQENAAPLAKSAAARAPSLELAQLKESWALHDMNDMKRHETT